MRTTLPDLAAVALLLALAALFLGDALFTDDVYMPVHTRECLPWRDSADPALVRELAARSNWTMTDQLFMFAPEIELNRRYFEAGKLPLWNPYVVGGVPHLAQQVPASYSPLIAPTLLSNPLEAWGWIAALHLALAAVFMHLYLRAIGLPVLPALVGAIVFGFSAWMTTRLHYYQISGASLGLPAGLLGVELLHRGRRLGGALLIAAAVALIFLAGFPQIAVITVYAVAAYVAVRAVVVWRSDGRRRALGVAGIAAAAVLLGLAVSAAQLAPAARFSYGGESTRADMTFAAYQNLRLSPEALTMMLAPRSLGSPDFYRDLESPQLGTSTLLQTALLGPSENCVEISGYVGLAALVLALLAALRALGLRAGLPLRFWTAATVIAVLLMLGTPLLAATFRLPGLSFGAPMRFLFPATFGLAVLAAYGARMLAPPAGRRALVAPIAGAVLALALILLGAWVYTQPTDSIHDWISQRIADRYSIPAEQVPAELATLGITASDIDANVELVRRSGLHVLIWGLAALAVAAIAAFSVRPRARAIWAVTILAVVSADLMTHGRAYNRAVPSTGYLEATPLTTFLRDHAGHARILRFGGALDTRAIPLMPNLGIFYGIHDAQGYITMIVRRYAELLNRLEPGCASPAGIRNPTQPAALASPILDLLGVKYVLAREESLPGLGKAVARDGSTRVFENPGALPRAFLVRAVQAAGSSDDVLDRLATPGFDPRQAVICEQPLPGDWPATAAPAAVDEARIGHYGLRSVTIDVRPAARSVLVLTDNWSAGWTVTVDGVERPLHRVDHTFRAVVVTPEDRQVYFFYDPGEAKASLGVSLAAAAIWCLGLLWLAVGTLVGRCSRKHTAAAEPEL